MHYNLKAARRRTSRSIGFNYEAIESVMHQSTNSTIPQGIFRQSVSTDQCFKKNFANFELGQTIRSWL